MSWHETPQQAIEGYLEALLSDDAQDEDLSDPFANTAEPPPVAREESFQGRHLSDALEQARQQQPAATRPQVALQEANPGPQVLMPELQLAPEAVPEPQTEVTAPELQTEPEIVQEAPQAEDSAQPLVAEADPEPEAPPVVEPQVIEGQVPDADQPPSPPGWKNGRPVWAQERFECLLFKVKGLTLAVPLVELGGIIKVDKEPTPLFGQPDWFMGMVRSNDMNVCMVDTAQWVLPPALIEKNPEPYKLIIRIHNSVWGLACNEVDRSISLQTDQVRWRTSLGKRPWLAGTVIDHMCALIDVAAFDRLLKEGHGQMEPANLSALKELDA